MSFTKVSKVFAGCTKCSRGPHLVQVNLSLELFENRIFVRGPSDFHLEFFIRKPNCSNCETFENRGLTVGFNKMLSLAEKFG